MRVLFLAIPGVGHVFPLVPLAWAIRAAGHEILLGTCTEGLVGRAAGLPIADIDPDFRMQEFIDDAPIALSAEAARRRDITFDMRMFEAVNRRLVASAVDLAVRWRPDLVVSDELAAIGPLAAAAVGVPAAQVSISFVSPLRLQTVFASLLEDLYVRHGVPDGGRRTTMINPVPPSMAPEPQGRPIRYVPYNGDGIFQDWIMKPPARPRVAITVGSVTPVVQGLGLIKQVLDVATEVDAEFVLALGGNSADSIGAVPDNVRALPWIPMNALLTTCAAVIHHGGGGTTLTSLGAGVPQLVVPSFADRFFSADAVRDRGVGLSADPAELAPALIERLLTDQQLRAAAREVRAEMVSMPSPASVAAELFRSVVPRSPMQR
jgi:UDP:flavonoid glycosyltransferase YjiC (YdhE family)